MDPAWSSKQQPIPPQPAHAGQSSYHPAEDKLHRLVAALQKSDTEQTMEVQQILEESATVEVTSQSVHKALRKVDSARAKFKAATTARQKLHDNWSKYIEESVKRWRGFADDFTKKDQALEKDVETAMESLQQARQHLDEVKEQHSKQDAAYLKSTVEIVSDMEDEPQDKMDDSEAIQEGIATMISSLDTIKLRQKEIAKEDEHMPKKLKGGDGVASRGAMEPFGGPGK